MSRLGQSHDRRFVTPLVGEGLMRILRASREGGLSDWALPSPRTRVSWPSG